MKGLQRKLILSLVTVMMLFGFLYAQEKIVLATLEWEPYIGKSLPGEGYVAEIVKEAFKREGITVTFQYYPWARTVDMAKRGLVDGYFPEYYAKEVEEHSIFSQGFPGGPIVFFKRKADKISYNQYEDLKKYNIGVVRGYVNEEKFDKATWLKKDEAVDDATNINKLLNKRIDLLVADKFVGLYLINKSFKEKAGEIDYIDKPLINHKLYVCFGKNARNSTRLVKAFNSGLEKITTDGTVNKILKKHGF